mgnify:CR=1 FL=1
MPDNTNEKKENQELGALWKKESKNGGQKYLAGHITVEDDMGVESKIKVVVFANRDKKNERYPDFRILKAREFQTTAKTETSNTEEVSQSVDEDIL